jgi:hypothetical protein
MTPPSPGPEIAATRARRWLAAAGILLSMACADLAFPAQTDCTIARARVEGGTETDRWQACMAAREAIAFLAAHGLEFDGAVVIRVLPRLPSVDARHAVAVFDGALQEIRVLGYEAAARAALVGPLAIWPVMTPALWRSFVAHEVAHLVAGASFAADVPQFTATEYIACVTQIAVLPRDLRDEILARYSEQSAFEHEGQINAILYLIDPSAFTIRAYRHFSALQDGARFLEVLLENGAPSDYELR